MAARAIRCAWLPGPNRRAADSSEKTSTGVSGGCAASWLPWATMSTRCTLAGRVRTASLVLNSKYLPGLRMLAGKVSKLMFSLAMGHSLLLAKAFAAGSASGTRTRSPSSRRRR